MAFRDRKILHPAPNPPRFDWHIISALTEGPTITVDCGKLVCIGLFLNYPLAVPPTRGTTNWRLVGFYPDIAIPGRLDFAPRRYISFQDQDILSIDKLLVSCRRYLKSPVNHLLQSFYQNIMEDFLK
jgi:hypothetical protein